MPFDIISCLHMFTQKCLEWFTIVKRKCGYERPAISFLEWFFFLSNGKEEMKNNIFSL